MTEVEFHNEFVVVVVDTITTHTIIAVLFKISTYILPKVVVGTYLTRVPPPPLVKESKKRVIATGKGEILLLIIQIILLSYRARARTSHIIIIYMC